MQATEKITLVLRPHAGYTIADLQQYAKLGMPAGVGRSLGVIAGASEGDLMERVEQLENQVILAESAMRRGALMHDQDHIPALHRVIDHVPTLYLEVADQIKQAALEDGDDETMAEEAAGQAIRVLVLFKQRLEKLLEPDLLSVDKDRVNQSSETVENVNRHIDDRIKEVAAKLDPRTLFARINPIGASAEELEMGRNGFVDDRVHGDFLIWKSGFNAALEADPCAS